MLFCCDCTQCAGYRKKLDFGCSGISETGWRKLGVDERTQQNCPKCRVSSLTGSNPDSPETLDTIDSEIRATKRQLQGLPSLIEDILVIKTEMVEFRDGWGKV